MKTEDAAKILQLNDKITPEIVKKAYRQASNKYHPDKGGSDEMMKAVNQAYSVLKEYEGIVEVSESDINYPEFLNEACSGLIEMDTLIKDNVVNYWSPYESKTSIQELPKRV